jgi:hypothetical protein
VRGHKTREGYGEAPFPQVQAVVMTARAGRAGSDQGSGELRQAYLERWPASETTFGQDKATSTGAGDRTSGPVLRSSRPRPAVHVFWAWMCGTQLVLASTAAALASDAARAPAAAPPGQRAAHQR